MMNTKSPLPPYVTIKTPPSEHETPFAKQVVSLLMGYELECDEHWEVGPKTLDMGK